MWNAIFSVFVGITLAWLFADCVLFCCRFFFLLLRFLLRHRIFCYEKKEKNNIFRLSYFSGAAHTQQHQQQQQQQQLLQCAMHTIRSNAIIYTRRNAFANPFSCNRMCWVQRAHPKMHFIVFIPPSLFFPWLCFLAPSANMQSEGTKCEIYRVQHFVWIAMLPSDHFNPFQWIIDVIFYAFMHWYENIVSIFFDQYQRPA